MDSLALLQGCAPFGECGAAEKEAWLRKLTSAALDTSFFLHLYRSRASVQPLRQGYETQTDQEALGNYRD